jgi:dTDP-4-dehydrorhamnose 3,5-epimerase
MHIEGTSLDGVFVLFPERHVDERGWFARTLCVDELAAAGLHADFPQHNASWNERRGTLRGLHAQRAPHQEVKVVRVVRGRVFDVVVDARPGSATLGQWAGFELSATAGGALYIPGGFLHGFLTLEDDTEVHYAMGSRFVPDAAFGVCWNDATLGITWPEPARVISPRDAALATWAEVVGTLS